MESSVVMRKPAEILDEDHELVVERVCAIDVAKASGMVCTRLPQGAAGRRVSRVWEVAATTRAITELADHLVAVGIEQVTVESTSDYWRIWFYLLEARGLDVQLVNARDVKNLPGRPKTDKLDAVWLAKLTEKGLLRPSFVPPMEIRQLRDYTRLRVDLTRERTRHWQRLEKLLEDALIKVSSVASKLDTRSVRDMLEALIAGDRDPRRLAELARGRMKTKRAALVEALSGRFDEHHAEIARMLLDQIDGLSATIDQLTTRAELLLQTLLAARAGDPRTGGAGSAVHAQGSCDPRPAPTRATEVPVEAPTEACVPADGTPAHRGGNRLSAAQRLDEIAGIGPLAAQVIIAEIGLDMSRFPTAGHLVSWAKLCPRTIQSGTTRRGGAAGPGRWSALLRPTPLRTVHATHRGTRPKQATRAVQVVGCSTVFAFTARVRLPVRPQVACTRCVRSARGVLGAVWWTRWSALIAFFVTHKNHRSQPSGDWGGWSGISRFSPHRVHRPSCLDSRRTV